VLKKFKIILNPTAGRGKAKSYIDKIEDFFKQEDVQFELSVTERPLHATEIAREAVSRFNDFIVVGGDGTINEVINGIHGNDVNLGIIPVGSGNDFIKCVNIPRDFEESVKVILSGKIRKIDLGKMGNRFFPNGLGIGFDALAAEYANKIKLFKGTLIYLISVFKAYFKFTPPVLTIESDNRIIKKRIFFTTIGNGICLGSKFYLTPEAKPDDGMFDICIVEPVSMFKMVKLIPKVFKGEHLNEKIVTYFKAKHLHISSDIGTPVHMDGEVISLNLKNFDVELVPNTLKLYVP
jgi:YegS/Rv2252/BmrU family lipid kinase